MKFDLNRYPLLHVNIGQTTFLISLLVLFVFLTSCAPEGKVEETGIAPVEEVKKKVEKPVKTVAKVTNSPSDNINYRDVDLNLLENLIHQEINKVKRANGLPLLSKDKTLRNAATDQNNYQIRLGDLSHVQSSAAKKDLQSRINYYGGGMQAMAENVIYEGFIIRTQGSKREIITPSYKEQAKKMVVSWMNSPGHRKNIMNPNYVLVGTAVAYHNELHAIFSTQVFGRRFNQ